MSSVAPVIDAATPDSSDDGLARPIAFDARYGDGLELGVSLGGGGIYFVAWQVAYLHHLAENGVRLDGAGRVVGTSAGSLVASVLECGRLGLLHAELRVLAKLPKVIGALAPADDLQPSQQRAALLFGEAPDGAPDRVRGIGHAALAARTPSPSVMARNLRAVIGTSRWPSAGLHITCVDAYTGERCVVTRAARVGLARAAAASSAVPGLFPPQPILDRRCMDGGVSGTGIHLDLLAGARRVVVLCLTDGHDVTEARMTTAPGSIQAEIAALQGSGTELLLRTPESMQVDKLMDPTAVPEAIEMGRRQAAGDLDVLREFLA